MFTTINYIGAALHEPSLRPCSKIVSHSLKRYVNDESSLKADVAFLNFTQHLARKHCNTAKIYLPRLFVLEVFRTEEYLNDTIAKKAEDFICDNLPPLVSDASLHTSPATSCRHNSTSTCRIAQARNSRHWTAKARLDISYTTLKKNRVNVANALNWICVVVHLKSKKM